MNSWNGLDFFIFLILVVNTVHGMIRGATREIISLMCLSAVLIFSIKFTVPLANFFNSSPLAKEVVDNQIIRNFMIAINAGPLTTSLLSQIMYSISLLICFVSVFSLCEAGSSMTGILEAFSFPYAALNRKVGGALGFTRGYIICLMFLSILTLHIYKTTNSTRGDFVSGSFFANLFQSQVQKFDELISSQQPENYNKLYQNQPYNVKNLYKNLNVPSGPLQPQEQPVK